MKQESDINPCAKSFCIIEFDLKEYRDMILSSMPWLLGSSRLCMKPWTPSFDPLLDLLTLDPDWVTISNLPFDFWGIPSLKSIGNALGKFHFNNPEH